MQKPIGMPTLHLLFDFHWSSVAEVEKTDAPENTILQEHLLPLQATAVVVQVGSDDKPGELKVFSILNSFFFTS